jgi:Fur family ferric uptake transcriptional regulator
VVTPPRIAEQQAARIHDVIRQGGGRLTGPTRTVVAVLLDGEHHRTADDVIAEVGRRTPGVAPSTVYRVLQRLDDLGVVEHVHSGTGPTFYHLRDRGHAHLVCNECGRIIDVPDAVFAPLSRAVQRTFGFTVHPHHAALLGRCADCAR